MKYTSVIMISLYKKDILQVKRLHLDGLIGLKDDIMESQLCLP